MRGFDGSGSTRKYEKVRAHNGRSAYAHRRGRVRSVALASVDEQAVSHEPSGEHIQSFIQRSMDRFFLSLRFARGFLFADRTMVVGRLTAGREARQMRRSRNLRAAAPGPK